MGYCQAFPPIRFKVQYERMAFRPARIRKDPQCVLVLSEAVLVIENARCGSIRGQSSAARSPPKRFLKDCDG